jgi:hypothetical protein
MADDGGRRTDRKLADCHPATDADTASPLNRSKDLPFDALGIVHGLPKTRCGRHAQMRLIYRTGTEIMEEYT